MKKDSLKISRSRQNVERRMGKKVADDGGRSISDLSEIFWGHENLFDREAERWIVYANDCGSAL